MSRVLASGAARPESSAMRLVSSELVIGTGPMVCHRLADAGFEPEEDRVRFESEVIMVRPLGWSAWLRAGRGLIGAYLKPMARSLVRFRGDPTWCWVAPLGDGLPR